jgi:hypothetical protein
MRIPVVVLLSLGTAVSTVRAQALERLIAPANTSLLTSLSDRTFRALIPREMQSLFKFDLLRTATLEHTPGATGESFVVPLTSPPPAVTSLESARRSEPAPVATSSGQESAGSSAPVQTVREPVREPAPIEVPREEPNPVTPGEPREPPRLEPIESPPVTSTPEPATIALTASGLAALGGYVRRRRRVSREP